MLDHQIDGKGAPEDTDTTNRTDQHGNMQPRFYVSRTHFRTFYFVGATLLTFWRNCRQMLGPPEYADKGQFRHTAPRDILCIGGRLYANVIYSAQLRNDLKKKKNGAYPSAASSHSIRMIPGALAWYQVSNKRPGTAWMAAS